MQSNHFYLPSSYEYINKMQPIFTLTGKIRPYIKKCLTTSVIPKRQDHLGPFLLTRINYNQGMDK